MATTTLTPYIDQTTQATFNLVSSGSTGARWLAAGRSIAEPYSVELIRKIGPSSASANDHVLVRVQRTDRNTTTGKFATMSVTMDVSIPKDVSIITPTIQKNILGVMTSLLNEAVANAATTVNRTAVIEGRDF